MRKNLAVAIALAALACGPAPAELERAVARFELADAPLAFDAAPFPGDFRRGADGALEIGALPTRQDDSPAFVRLRALLGARRGFCATCSIYFPIDGEIDRESLPRDTTGTVSDAIVLVDVDPDSPERGRLFPLRVEWNDDLALVAIHPAHGIALRGQRRYAAAITSDLRAVSGAPLEPSPTFEAMREELTSGLVEAGVDGARIVSATVFTTEDVTADLRGARAVVRAGAAPTVAIDQVWHAGTELDELLGVPAEDRPGIDVTPMTGTAGVRAIRHESVALVIAGRIRAPRLVTGLGVEVGELSLDTSGEIVAGALEDVPFLLTIPDGIDVASVPVIVHQHGFNASRTTGFAIAETAAREGIAVLSIDAYQHGARASSASDETNAMRETDGADGFAEASLVDVSSRVFGLSGVPRGAELSPSYPLAAFVQYAADIMSVVRFVEEGDLDPLRAADPALASLAFDSARIEFLGNSMGAVVGTSVLVVEPSIRRAVLNVPPGSIIENLADSPEFRPLTSGVFLSILGVPRTRFDEIDRHLVMDPIVDLMRWGLEPIDPLALAPHLFEDRLDAEPPPEVLFQTAGLDEVAWRVATESFLAAAGAAHVTRYDSAGHGMLEVRDQSSEWEPPYETPLVPRAMPIPIVNPLEAIHEEIGSFLAR